MSRPAEAIQVSGRAAHESGFGNAFSSEALPGALPVGQDRL